jgi:hypothetical protein
VPLDRLAFESRAQIDIVGFAVVAVGLATG